MTDMGDGLQFRDILYNDDQLGPFPMHMLKHVSEPTNRIVGTVERQDPRENAFARAAIGDFGKQVQEEFFRMTVRYPIGAALVDLQHHIAAIRNNRNEVASKKAPIPEDPRVRSRHLKCLGYFLGADIVGTGRLNQSAVYTYDRIKEAPIEALYKYAIVLVVRKSEKTICASNGWDHIVDPASFQAYQRVALQSEGMANYIRRLGYSAEPSYTFNYLTLMPQVLLDGGIGEVCRMGIILNPFIGTNFKASCVLTNLEIETDGPVDFGLQEYCRTCKICAEQCPAGAISHDDQVLYNGYYTWKLNTRACAEFDILNKEGCVCGRCTKVCPWHRPHTEPHDFAGWNGDVAELYRSVNEQREKLVENNYVDPAERTDKWWFELDEVEGCLTVPGDRNAHKICSEHPLTGCK